MICGIDLGSRDVKIALMDVNKYVDFLKFDTIKFYKNFGRTQDGQLVINFRKLGLPLLKKVVSTGYGRNTINLAGAETIPEIKAHVLGAVYQTKLKNFTLLDLGGQDSKVVKVVKGKMFDFKTNDRCAANSGRYLENMAAVLGISLEELSKYREAPVELNATCAIFGESELIGKIVEGSSIAQLAAGVNYTIFKRVYPFLKQFVNGDPIVFTGGVAFNGAIREIIAEETGAEVIVPPHPQFNGAIGCCIYGGAGEHS